MSAPPPDQVPEPPGDNHPPAGQQPSPGNWAQRWREILNVPEPPSASQKAATTPPGRLSARLSKRYQLDDWAERWREFVKPLMSRDALLPAGKRAVVLKALLYLALGAGLLGMCGLPFLKHFAYKQGDPGPDGDIVQIKTLADAEAELQAAILNLQAPPEKSTATSARAPERASEWRTEPVIVVPIEEATQLAELQGRYLLLIATTGDYKEGRFTDKNAETLRRGALAYVWHHGDRRRQFVVSHLKVSEVPVANRQDQGGPLATFFCLADGRVIHIGIGATDGGNFRVDLQLATRIFCNATDAANVDTTTFCNEVGHTHAWYLQNKFGLSAAITNIHNLRRSAAQVHYPEKEPGAFQDSQHPLTVVKLDVLERQRALPPQARMHLLLALFPGVKVHDVYRYVFTHILT